MIALLYIILGAHQVANVVVKFLFSHIYVYQPCHVLSDDQHIN